MEKFYIVTDKCKLRQLYLDYYKNLSDVNDVVIEFMNKHGMETHQYHAGCSSIMIVPSEKDAEKFGKMLCVEERNGLRAFKRGSKVGKDWVKMLEEKGLKVYCKPHVSIFFRASFGENSSRLFMIKDVVYCNYCSSNDFQNPEGMIEIKASEFYKVIEDYEEEQAREEIKSEYV